MAEGGGILEKSKLLVNCSICLEKFKQPKFLPCHRTFCSICLEEYIERSRRGNTFECPLCRKQVEVPNKGVDEFQTNFYLDFEDNEQNEIIICDGCDGKLVAEHRCFECEEHYCTRCTESHMKMKMSRNHKLIELKSEEPGTRRKMKDRPYCENHPNEEIKILCAQCNQLLCVLCMLLDHQGHKLREVTTAARELREKLQTAIEEKCIDDTLSRQKKITFSLKETATKLATSQDREIKVLRDHGGKVHKALDEVIAKIEATLVKKYTASLKEIEDLSKLSATFSLSLQSLIATTRQVVDHATDVEILQKGDSLHKQLLGEISKDPVGKEYNENQDIGNIFTGGSVNSNVLQNMVGSINDRESTSFSLKVTRDLDVSPVQDRLVKVGSINDRESTSFSLKVTRDLDVSPVQDRLVKVSTCTVATDGGNSPWDIAPISAGRAWIYFRRKSILQQIDSTGNVLLSVDLGSGGEYFITADGEENCLIGVNNSIKRVSKTGQIDVIVSNTGGSVYGLAYRKRSNGNEEVLFSCTSTLYVAPYTTNSSISRWVSRNFSWVYKIAVDDITKKVCISDHNGHSVIILNEEGEILSQYSTDFCPFSVCFDFKGAVVITHRPSLAMNRIKTDGTFVEKLSIITGSSVAMYKDYRMWVGKNNGVIETYELR